jgi:hypothetical protein
MSYESYGVLFYIQDTIFFNHFLQKTDLHPNIRTMSFLKSAITRQTTSGMAVAATMFCFCFCRDVIHHVLFLRGLINQIPTRIFPQQSLFLLPFYVIPVSVRENIYPCTSVAEVIDIGILHTAITNSVYNLLYPSHILKDKL